MHILKDVTHAEHIDHYTLLLKFDDGVHKLVNLEDYLDGEVFRPLRDIHIFKSFTVNKDTGTIEWPNQADFSPDFLYEIGKIVEQPMASFQDE